MSRLPVDSTAVSWTTCPECGQVAEILWGVERPGVDLVKIQCLQRHWFLMPESRLPFAAGWWTSGAAAA